MSQIMYNYPAMLGHAGDMSGYAGTLQGLGADIASEQAALFHSDRDPVLLHFPALATELRRCIVVLHTEHE